MNKQMTSKKSLTDYWFVIEPYVYVRVTKAHALLYNTLDGVTLESYNIEIINLLRELLEKENCGVLLLRSNTYMQKEINNFIRVLRKNYMGDIIDINLSNGKPVQLMPYYNYPNNHKIYKKKNFTPISNILENLTEISIHVDNTTDIQKMISFLKSMQGAPIFNIVGNVWDIPDYYELFTFLKQHPSQKNLLCSYTQVKLLQVVFEEKFSYNISVHFPINMHELNNAILLLCNQTSPIEFSFHVSSIEDLQQTERLVEQFKIKKYQMIPIYTGDNMRYFEENVFLTKKDILSLSISMKDIFIHQSMNIYDYGKISIMSNGDAYANINYPILGNIFKHSFQKIVQKEVDEGKSWFRIRNQAPCNDCVYQWLCPSPSNYEIVIGRSNLCHVIQQQL